ncbi:MAG: bfd domain-containing protein (2fe-2S)-binding domain-containing protein [Pseudomonadota bacterium]
MYFCNCRGIRESDVNAAIDKGCCTYKSAYRACTGEKPVCGMCQTDFPAVLARHSVSQASMQVSAPTSAQDADMVATTAPVMP